MNTDTRGRTIYNRHSELSIRMSLNLNDAAMAGNVEEVLIRLNMGEDVNQKCYPRSVMRSIQLCNDATNPKIGTWLCGLMWAQQHCLLNP